MESAEKIRKGKYERPVIQKLNTGLMNKFGTSMEVHPVLDIDGVPVKKLVSSFGSPLFVLSETSIRKQYKRAYRAFSSRYPKVQFAWSYKTNYLNAVGRIFHQEGSWAEVVSGFEYAKAIANGVPGEKIIFNGPDKSKEDLLTAVQNNTLIHIDHLDELYTLIHLTREKNLRARVAIRVNMDTGVYPIWDRFGLNYENGRAWDAINKIFASDNLELTGLHTHIGTYMLSSNAYKIAATKLAELAIRIHSKYGKWIDYIDMGGGFPSRNNLKGAYLPGVDIVPPLDEFAEAISSALLNSDLDFNHLPKLILETGRALIDESGYLISTVIANKHLSDGRRATIIDAGVNILFTSFWYNHKISPAQDFSGFRENTELFGPLCMNIDVIRESALLPPLNNGDKIVIHNVGAYNMTQWMQFITYRPRVVLISPDGKPHIIREQENLEYINQMEHVPDYLRTP